MGTSFHVLAAPQSNSGGFNPETILLVVVVLAVLYFLILRPNQRRQRQAQERQNSLRPGARVTTIGGMKGTVTAVDDESGDVVLEVAPGVEVRYIKQAIRSVDSPGDEPEAETGPDEPETEAETDDETVSEDETESEETESDETEPEDETESVSDSGDSDDEAKDSEDSETVAGQS